MSFDRCSSEGHFQTGNTGMAFIMREMDPCGIDFDTARDRDVGIAIVKRVQASLAEYFSSNDGWEVLPMESREMAAKMTGRAGEGIGNAALMEIIERFKRFCEASPGGFFVV